VKKKATKKSKKRRSNHLQVLCTDFAIEVFIKNTKGFLEMGELSFGERLALRWKRERERGNNKGGNKK
jgi:hypothetical protein